MKFLPIFLMKSYFIKHYIVSLTYLLPNLDLEAIPLAQLCKT